MIVLNRVLIFGMGLMGGSLSLAIKKKFPNALITGVVRSEKSKLEIQSTQMAHSAYTEMEFLAQSNWDEFDLVVFSTPVGSVLDYIQKLPLSANTIYTDLGSTKQTIIDAVNGHFKIPHNYVSSHPMCGSEFSGAKAAKDDLYENKLCILTSANNSNSTALAFLKSLWESVGSWTLEMDGIEHDTTLAYLSHLPHIVSSILVKTAIRNQTVNRLVNSSEKPITGGGFRDMTRIAGSNAEMWISIFLENQKNVYDSLVEYRKEIDSVIEDFNPIRPLAVEKILQYWESSLLAKEHIQKTKV